MSMALSDATGERDDGLFADVGIFGGSGLYQLLEDAHEYLLPTPYGEPSGSVTIATMGHHQVAFLPRHGPNHEYPPHRINYRANAWLMHSLGVRALFGPCASGSLQPDITPGDVVICDQIVDRTSGRHDTYCDGPEISHLSFADPYDEGLCAIAIAACRDEGVRVHEQGTVVVIQGPRFSTRAESRWYRDAGWHVINMTQYPEAALAAELDIPYAALALITDYDCGLVGDPDVAPVTQEEVFAIFQGNIEMIRSVLARAVSRVPFAGSEP